MSSLKIIKLTNGEDIICYLEEFSDQDIQEFLFPEQEPNPNVSFDVIFVRDPMKLFSEYNEKQKNWSVHLRLWMPFSEDELFIIPKNQVVTITTPIPEVEKHYCNTKQHNIKDIPLLETEEEAYYKEFLEQWSVNKIKDTEH